VAVNIIRIQSEDKMALQENIANRVSNVRDQVMSKSPQEEGKITKAVESQTAKVPSIGYLGLAVGSMVISAGLELLSSKQESKHYGNFVGLWAPCFLLMGIYNKLVKLEGSDQASKA
jgi:hypothetical protein